MIKIERNNIEEIANEYCNQMMRIIGGNVKGTTDCHNYYLKYIKDFIMCSTSDFEKMKNEFEANCESEIELTAIAQKEYDDFINDKKYKGKKQDPVYISKKESLKNAISKTPYMLFTQSMQELYKDSFQKKVELSKNGKVVQGDPLGIWLAKELDVRTCPYCNRAYTFTVKTKHSVRPELDHFRPKSVFPYFALSFYNLIPSCPVCNHVKKENIINIHPYEKAFGDEYKFQLDILEYMLKNRITKVSIKVDDNNTNVETLMLNELYNEHLDYINELVDKAKAYNADYYNGIIESFHQLGARPSEIDRYIWGCYLDVAEQGKRPLSKLTRDILDQLDIDH